MMRKMSSPDNPSQSRPAKDLSPSSERDFFRELGVQTFINAAGTYTLLSASLMLPEVVAAMSYAAKHFVDIDELQTAAGERIAELLGCEAAMVTSGAAAALTVGTAACLTGEDPVRVRQIPDLTGLKGEVIIQRAHRFLYDHAIRNCGVKFNLFKYLRMGFDLVTFSGGKGIRGPQNAGLLLGRKDLIRAARLNSSPNGDAIGRGYKVSKETILGMVVALETYLKRDSEAETKEWERRIQLLANSLADIEALKVEIFTPAIANHVPHLKVTWNLDSLKVSADDIRQQLRAGTVSIEAVPTYSYEAAEDCEEIRFGVWMMQPNEAETVAQRLREVFRQASPISSPAKKDG